MALIAHYKLNGDLRDSVSGRCADGHNVEFTAGVDGCPQGAALFDGKSGSVVTVPDHPQLHLGSSDFTVSCWICPADGVDNVPGDILSKFDDQQRRGFNLFMHSSSPGYCSIGSLKSVGIGIDAGTDPVWEDCGKPLDSNTLISTLTVYNGALYTGIADAERPEDYCRVYRYAGGQHWVDCGKLGHDDRNHSVHSMVVHQEALYAGTGTWDWDKTFLGIGGANRVFRYLGGTEWKDCGSFGDGLRVMTLASFKGSLYAGDDHARFYRYCGGRAWELCGWVNLNATDQLNCMLAFNGRLYAGSNFGGFFVYDEVAGQWQSIGDKPFGVTQNHSLQVYRGKLHAGTWIYGHVLRYEGDSEWSDCGCLGMETDKTQINEVNDLTVYNGKLYAGVIPFGEVYRYERDFEWSTIRRLVNNQSEWSLDDPVSWNRVPCLTVFAGRMFAGTSTLHGRVNASGHHDVGRVFAMKAGECVTLDQHVGDGWSHVKVVKQGGEIRLYINGVRRAGSDRFDPTVYNLDNSSPLTIGFGPQQHFSGAIADVRIYNSAE